MNLLVKMFTANKNDLRARARDGDRLTASRLRELTRYLITNAPKDQPLEECSTVLVPYESKQYTDSTTVILPETIELLFYNKYDVAVVVFHNHEYLFQYTARPNVWDIVGALSHVGGQWELVDVDTSKRLEKGSVDFESYQTYKQTMLYIITDYKKSNYYQILNGIQNINY